MNETNAERLGRIKAKTLIDHEGIRGAINCLGVLEKHRMEKFLADGEWLIEQAELGFEKTEVLYQCYDEITHLKEKVERLSKGLNSCITLRKIENEERCRSGR